MCPFPRLTIERNGERAHPGSEQLGDSIGTVPRFAHGIPRLWNQYTLRAQCTVSREMHVFERSFAEARPLLLVVCRLVSPSERQVHNVVAIPTTGVQSQMDRRPAGMKRPMSGMSAAARSARLTSYKSEDRAALPAVAADSRGFGIESLHIPQTPFISTLATRRPPAWALQPHAQKWYSMLLLLITSLLGGSRPRRGSCFASSYTTSRQNI